MSMSSASITLQTRRRVVAAGRAAFLVAQPAAGQHDVGVEVDATELREPVAHRFDRPSVDEQDLVTLVVVGDADRPLAKAGSMYSSHVLRGSRT